MKWLDAATTWPAHRCSTRLCCLSASSGMNADSPCLSAMTGLQVYDNLQRWERRWLVDSGIKASTNLALLLQAPPQPARLTHQQQPFQQYASQGLSPASYPSSEAASPPAWQAAQPSAGAMPLQSAAAQEQPASLHREDATASTSAQPPDMLVHPSGTADVLRGSTVTDNAALQQAELVQHASQAHTGGQIGAPVGDAQSLSNAGHLAEAAAVMNVPSAFGEQATLEASSSQQMAAEQSPGSMHTDMPSRSASPAAAHQPGLPVAPTQGKGSPAASSSSSPSYSVSHQQMRAQPAGSMQQRSKNPPQLPAWINMTRSAERSPASPPPSQASAAAAEQHSRAHQQPQSPPQQQQQHPDQQSHLAPNGHTLPDQLPQSAEHLQALASEQQHQQQRAAPPTAFVNGRAPASQQAPESMVPFLRLLKQPGQVSAPPKNGATRRSRKAMLEQFGALPALA